MTHLLGNLTPKAFFYSNLVPLFYLANEYINFPCIFLENIEFHSNKKNKRKIGVTSTFGPQELGENS